MSHEKVSFVLLAYFWSPEPPTRKSDWITTDITLRLLKTRGSQKDQEIQDTLVTYTHRANGARQSKRLRQTKSQEERRKITVKKSTTVKDIKIMVLTLVCPCTSGHSKSFPRRTKSSPYRLFANASSITGLN